jgi:hypothetical protein
MSTRLQEDLQTASRTIKRQQKQIIEMRNALSKANAYLQLGNGVDARKVLDDSAKRFGIYGLEVE